ncbi:Anticodon-binding [Cynara cardunculus var. scolymus]|uniref:histidine--tRNA ligase n=1 Tax=Cynara cardunculus var. scolymus TaxID=59895 RepID=A0A118K5T0_CYNCS|nr:Anticodon-binding [Cynara cardunculus var. scolymus]
MAGERRVLTLGGKGSSLSSASVFEFAIASPPMLLKIDPSALARLSSAPSNQKSSSPPFKFQQSVPDFLTPEEARASILLLLYKILLGGSSSSSSTASQLSDILNNETQTPTIDLDVARQDDLYLLNSCWPGVALHGICALLDHTASSLATVADAVAALSCEALKADASTAFNFFTDSGDGSSDKDRVAVANDFKVLLNGSKLRGNLQCDQVYNIPIIHGRLRSLCKSVHSSTRVELNSIPSAGGGASEDLTALLSSLAFALQNLGDSSWTRAKLCLQNLAKDNLFPSLAESFSAGCPDLDSLKASINSFVSSKMEKSYIRSLHEIYNLSEAVRKILSWEATVSFISLEGSELMENGQVGTQVKEDIDGVSAKSDKKKDKKKKVMGKGTTVLMQFIKDRLQSVPSKVVDSSALPERVAQGFLSFLDLKDPGFEHLLQKVKDVVDSNESRRLPKLPKGTRDFAKEQMAVREKAFSIIGNVFKRHGAMALDTPVFELRETLTGKYGEDSKLIYDLADQIKLNHRKLLDGMLDICGVPSHKVRTICSSIDKLDKQSFDQIQKEMIEEKGLDAKTVEKIGSFVKLRGHPLKLLLELKKEGSEFLTNDASNQALKDLEKLFQALDNSRCVDKVVLDLSLARGLDYYTGALRASETQVLVSILGDDISLAAKLVSMCWDAKLKAEFMANKRLTKHFDRAKEFGIPWMVIVGEREINEGIVKLKNKEAKVEVEVPTSNFVDELMRLMNDNAAAAAAASR